MNASFAGPQRVAHSWRWRLMNQPGLNSNDSDTFPLEEILAEFRARLGSDDPPSLIEFQSRFPEHAESLPDLLTAVTHLDLEQVLDPDPKRAKTPDSIESVRTRFGA